jgi:Na+/H+ antiporter NhaD/arsenite permease-like protein
MSVGTILELVFAVALIVAAIVLYRRRGRDDPNHGSQTAVLVLVIGVVMLIHGLGLLDYRPSPTELAR